MTRDGPQSVLMGLSLLRGFAAVILAGCADGPTALQRTEIPFHRGLPHAYYDQAAASVRSLHPGHEVVVDVRIALIGDKTVSVYAYSTTAGAKTVHIEGCVVIGTAAQVFRGHTSRPLLNETLKREFGADLKELLDYRVPPAAIPPHRQSAPTSASPGGAAQTHRPQQYY